jgi:hypothetical protein
VAVDDLDREVVLQRLGPPAETRVYPPVEFWLYDGDNQQHVFDFLIDAVIKGAQARALRVPADVAFLARRYEAEGLGTHCASTSLVRAGDASGGALRRGDAPIYIVWGPYRELGPGRYRAVFALRRKGSAPPEQVVAEIDVSSNARDIFAVRRPTAGDLDTESFRLFELAFRLERCFPNCEFRILQTMDCSIEVDYVELQRVE